MTKQPVLLKPLNKTIHAITLISTLLVFIFFISTNALFVSIPSSNTLATDSSSFSQNYLNYSLTTSGDSPNYYKNLFITKLPPSPPLSSLQSSSPSTEPHRLVVEPSAFTLRINVTNSTNYPIVSVNNNNNSASDNESDYKQQPLNALTNLTQKTLDHLDRQSNNFCLTGDAEPGDFSNNNESSVIKVGYLTNIHGRNNQQRQGIVISGAITYAISKVNEDTSKFNGKRFELIANDTEGQALLGTSAILDQWRRGAVAFFGPEDSCEVEATIASAINLPMISYKCADSKASNKHFYRTFVRTHPPDTQIVSSVIALLTYFKWKKFSIISEKSTQYQTVARNLAEKARASNFTINSESKFDNIYACCVDHKPCCHDALYNIIEETFKRTRIYVFLGTVNDLMNLMQYMQVKNLFNNGEYLVIYIDLDQYTKALSYKYFWRSDMDYVTKKTMYEAARSLLVVVTSPPNVSTYTDFEESVQRYNKLPPFNFTQPFEQFKKHITIYASYLYDAFMLYADALEETIKSGADIHDGAAIVKRIINRKSYQSITGPWMNIDSNGDVEGNYSVLALRPATGDLKFLRVMEDFNQTMLPVCNFIYENNTLRLTGTIDWGNTSKGARQAPLDEPRCAYDGSICRKPDSFKETLAWVQLTILVILSIVVSQVYRNWKKEQEIAGLLWRIAFDDVHFHGALLNRTQSRSSFASQMSNDSLGFRTTKNTYTKTATYKGSEVAIKELRFNSKKDKDIPRASKVEMKLMKEIRHDNINQFIGACIKQESNLIYIATEYCHKGSLQDILDNPDVKLDAMFVSSLVFDLLAGLNYLHNSELKCHGNLKSSNCVITSRWVLKLTDFGLHDFRMKTSSAPVRENMRHTHYRNQLWKAPELLRDSTMYGNQKTDVYAFGIILHEIIGRHGPFGIDTTSMKPEDVVDSIKNPKTCCSADLKINQTQGPSKLGRQGTSSSMNSNDQFHLQRQMKAAQYGISRNNSQIEMNSHAVNTYRYNQQNQAKNFIQLEMFKQHGKSVSLEAEPLKPVDVSRIPEYPEDDESEDQKGSPFLRGLKQIQYSVTNNGQITSGGPMDTLMLFRPDINLVQCPQYIIDTMRDCWAEKPENRPDLRVIRRRLKNMRQGTKLNIMDNMMAIMEKYANNLEDIVQERTAQLVEEKKKTEILLHRMLPSSVASQLLTGEEVEPESFNAVTIFFSDIVGFTELSSRSTPMQVVVFLNDLYTLFDAIIQEYNVYKVETIGDAYMVVSGLPERTNEHANEIASMAIELLKSVEDFKIRHLPKEVLQLRIGLHTGPVVAGVVGTTMPRYCLFGDTVNTASRMESHGQPLKIHTSPKTKEHLDKSGNYILESRGPINIKGKGSLETYWLLGHKNKSQCRYNPNNKLSNNVGLFDAIGQFDGKKKSPRVLHSQSIVNDDLFKINPTITRRYD